jgi:hypothetical protein
LKQNFFGDFINFTTLDEFKSKENSPTQESDSEIPLVNSFNLNAIRYNLLIQISLYEVCFTTVFENVEFIFPEHLYSFNESSRLLIDELQIDSRNADDFGGISFTYLNY